MNKLKILIITNLPVPYKIDFYRELSKFHDITVIFEGKRTQSQKFDWNDKKEDCFKSIYLSDLIENKVYFKVIKYLNHKFDMIFITAFHTPTGILSLLTLKFKRIKYIFEMDGAFPQTKENPIKYLLKKFLIKGAQRYFSPCKETDAYLEQYNVPKNLIIRYPFASYKEADILTAPLSTKEKEIIKSQLGIKEPKIIISVGQFIPRKGHDILIKALKLINDSNIGCYIIGDKPSNEYMALKEKYKLYNLHFVDFMNQKDLAKYYQAADIFTFPTREDIWGLVVNEAMSNGLPVITTNRCNAGLEMINTQNGYIINVEDSKELANKILYLLNNNEKRISMSHYAIKTAKQYSIESMTKTHINIIEKIDNI